MRDHFIADRAHALAVERRGAAPWTASFFGTTHYLFTPSLSATRGAAAVSPQMRGMALCGRKLGRLQDATPSLARSDQRLCRRCMTAYASAVEDLLATTRHEPFVFEDGTAAPNCPACALAAGVPGVGPLAIAWPCAFGRMLTPEPTEPISSGAPVYALRTRSDLNGAA